MPLPVIPDLPGGVLADATSPLQRVNIEADNTPPTLADNPLITALSPSNTGLPVNTPAIVQKVAAASTGSVATLAKAFATANVAGNSIVVVCACGNGTAMTVADSNSNTYTQAVTAPNSTTFETAIFYAVNILTGANTVTVTNAGTAASVAMEIYEVSGLIAQVAAQPGQTSLGTGTGTTATTSPLSGPPNSLAFMGVAVGTAAQAVTVTTGSTWTLDTSSNTTTPAGLFTFGALSLFLGGMKSVLPTATIAGSEAWAAASAIFKAVALGIDGTVAIHGYNYTHITLAAPTTTLVKTGPGVLHAIVVNKPVATAVIEADDAVTNATPIGIITIGTASAMPPFTVVYDAAFTVGLTIVTSTAACDLTIAWR